LEDDALFLLYTDGLTDLQNADDEYFDDSKVATFIEQNHALSTQDFNAKLMEDVNAFRGERSFPDDISVLTGKLFVDPKQNE
jgi:sigma-B regulation protein RsbU (phosphoserine phosphatase)